MKYPDVRDEFETIAAVSSGLNLGRCGDGEVKIAHGSGYSREPSNRRLSEEMREFIRAPNAGCLVGIPTLNPDSPKIETWIRYAPRFVGVVNYDMTYYSAFVTRPDSAPWIRTREYAESVQRLWFGKTVAVVCERKCKIFDTVRMGARAKHIECPHEQAYAVIDDLERAVCAAAADFAVLSAGPTATLLANRLAKRGVHAIDLGSAGRFLGELLR